MYRKLGEFVSRFPALTIASCLALFLAAAYRVPGWHEVWQDGEFTFLPDQAVSRQAELLFREAFPPVTEKGERFDGEEDAVGTPVQQDPLGSSVVIVAEREDRQSGLQPEDFDFIDQSILPKLEEIKRKTPRGYEFSPLAEGTEVAVEDQVIKGIVSRSDRKVGALLVSPNQKSTLIVVELASEFLDRQNNLVIARVEEMLNSSDLRDKLPAGLSLAISGSATVGRDMLRAEKVSASRTDAFTKGFVVVLLLLLYRAPLLAMVPLATVGIAVEMTLFLLRHMAKMGWIGVFTGLEIYVTVVVYGAGIDYCLFLIARYKEELDRGLSYKEAMATSVWKVGAALATSAGTSIFGIGMMLFAEFGKFRQAGFAISFGLLVVLFFALTFTPAAIVWLRQWAFWPDVRSEQVRPKTGGWFPSVKLWPQWNEQALLDRFWGTIANALRKYPGLIFAGTVAAMMPLAVVGYMYQSQLSYGLLTDLPTDDASVRGARVVQKHFAAGVTGPATVLIEFDRAALQKAHDGDDLTDIATAERVSGDITDQLHERSGELGIDDIRNQQNPLGQSDSAKAYLSSLVKEAAADGRRLRQVAVRNSIRNFAHKTYTSLQGDRAGTVMRFDLVFDNDPFARDSIAQLTKTEDAILACVPEAIRAGARVLTLGPTSGIRDLKTSTDRDQIKIDVLVTMVVFVLLVLLLGQPRICVYLILSVIFSYLVTMGATYIVFYLRDPSGFAGIDWKVPIYLFTILIAMGEDYNILLMARVQEEYEKYGPVEGVLHALVKTGSIISSCGVIMGGTFMTLMAGTLLGMVQLGFALAFGVFLDTFVVRPILVPAYLIMLNSGRLGWFGDLLGAVREVKEPDSSQSPPNPSPPPPHGPLNKALVQQEEESWEGV